MILTEEVPGLPVLGGEGHVELPVLLHQPLKLHLCGFNIKDAGTINHNVYLLVVVVAVQGLLEGLFGLSLELFRPASSRDADIGTFVGKTVHDGSSMLTEDVAQNI